MRAHIGICRPAAYPLPQWTSHPHCLRRFDHARAVTGRKYHGWRAGIGGRDCLVPPCGMDMDRSPFLRNETANEGVLAYLPLCLCAGMFRVLCYAIVKVRERLSKKSSHRYRSKNAHFDMPFLQKLKIFFLKMNGKSFQPTQNRGAYSPVAHPLSGGDFCHAYSQNTVGVDAFGLLVRQGG